MPAIRVFTTTSVGAAEACNVHPLERLPDHRSDFWTRSVHQLDRRLHDLPLTKGNASLLATSTYAIKDIIICGKQHGNYSGDRMTGWSRQSVKASIGALSSRCILSVDEVSGPRRKCNARLPTGFVEPEVHDHSVVTCRQGIRTAHFERGRQVD